MGLTTAASYSLIRPLLPRSLGISLFRPVHGLKLNSKIFQRHIVLPPFRLRELRVWVDGEGRINKRVDLTKPENLRRRIGGVGLGPMGRVMESLGVDVSGLLKETCFYKGSNVKGLPENGFEGWGFGSGDLQGADKQRILLNGNTGGGGCRLGCSKWVASERRAVYCSIAIAPRRYASDNQYLTRESFSVFLA